MTPLASAAAPIADGLSVRYARGVVTETYTMRPEAMEQSFVFAELPSGDGDLVVEVQLDTALPLQLLADDTLVFGGERGSVRIDGVVGIDAAGARMPGRLGYAGGVLTLRLPADFVRGATLPLVLDPLITAITPLTISPLGTCDAAYDASTGTWLTVWRQLAGTSGTSPSEVRGWFEPGGGVLLDTAGTQSDPVVADCNLRDAFVVAWPEADGIYARALRSPAQLGTTLRLNQGIGPTYGSLGIACNARPNTDRMLLCSRMTVGGTVSSANLFSFTIAANLAIGGILNVNASNSGGVYGNVDRVAIASSSGANGEHLVCWGQQVGANPAILSRTFDASGSPLGSAVGTAAPGTDLPEIVVDGQDGTWMAAFTSSTSAYPYPTYVYLMGIDRDATGALVQRDPVLIQADHGGGLLDIAVSGRRVVLAYLRVLIYGCTSTSGQCSSARLASFTLSDCLPCQPSEEYYTLPARTSLVRPAASGDAANPELVRGYSNIQARITLDNQVGLVTDLGGGCGGLQATSRAECAKTGGNYEAVLDGANGNSWLLIGTDRADLRGCGSCVLVPDPYTSAVIGPLRSNRYDLTTQAFAVPASPRLVGTFFLQQWLVPDPHTPGCAGFPFSFSNALQVQIQ